jgi:hypothetical protein
MNTLESKAKWYCPDCRSFVTGIIQGHTHAEQWVPLEEAQALEELAKGAIENNLTLRKNIAEANKILEEYTPKFNEYGHNYNIYDAKDVANIIGFLRDALNANHQLTVSDKKVTP